MNLFDMKGSWGVAETKIYNRLVAPALSRIYDQLLDRYLPAEGIKDGEKILDVGCGAGHVVALIARRFPRVELTGVDISEEMIARARDWSRGLPNVSVRTADALALPFEAASFDCVLSLASIKHWPDRVQGLKEIFRVLKPGGVLYIMEVHRNPSPDVALAFVRRWHLTPWPWTHIVTAYFQRFVASHGLTADELDAFCARAGFTQIKPETVAEFPAVVVSAVKPVG